MENNIEEMIRDDFRKRKIEPNANSFERLTAKLEVKRSNKRKRIISIFAYAASIIGLVFILQSVFKNNYNVEINEPAITNLKIKDSSNLKIVNSKDESPVILEQSEASNSKLKNLKELVNKKLIKENFVANSPKKSPSKDLEPTIIEKELTAIESLNKANLVISDTTGKRVKLIEITDEELDALLASANQTLVKKGSDSIVINAQSMHYEIEVEINKPLPEKVLLTLKTGATTINELVKSNDKENNKN